MTEVEKADNFISPSEFEWRFLLFIMYTHMALLKAYIFYRRSPIFKTVEYIRKDFCQKNTACFYQKRMEPVPCWNNKNPFVNSDSISSFSDFGL